MYIGISLQPCVRMSPPNITPYHSTQNHHTFPEPYRAEYRPVTPFYEAVQSKSEQRCKYHQTWMYQKFTGNKINTISSISQCVTRCIVLLSKYLVAWGSLILTSNDVWKLPWIEVLKKRLQIHNCQERLCRPISGRVWVTYRLEIYMLW